MTIATRERDEPTSQRPSPLRETLRTGASGGFVATIVMTAFRLPISRSLPPTDEFWRTYVSRNGGESATLPAILLHLLYGTGAGVAYAILRGRPAESDTAAAERRGVVTAVAYSLVLSVFGLRVLLNGLLDQELDSHEALIFHLGHVVYGITLGAWLGSRSGRK